jgi:hypothetical protein
VTAVTPGAAGWPIRPWLDPSARMGQGLISDQY